MISNISERVNSHLLSSVEAEAAGSFLGLCYEGTKTLLSQKQYRPKGIHFSYIHSAVFPHILKQKLACRRAVCPPTSTTVTDCTSTVKQTNRNSPPETRSKNTWHDGNKHISECIGLAVVGGRVSLFSLFDIYRIRSAICTCGQIPVCARTAAASL